MVTDEETAPMGLEYEFDADEEGLEYELDAEDPDATDGLE